MLLSSGRGRTPAGQPLDEGAMAGATGGEVIPRFRSGSPKGSEREPLREGSEGRSYTTFRTVPLFLWRLRIPVRPRLRFAGTMCFIMTPCRWGALRSA